MKKLKLFIIAALLINAFQSCTEEDLEPTLTFTKDLETSINTYEDLRSVSLSAYDRLTAVAYYGRDYIIFGEIMGDNCYANGSSGRFLEPASLDVGPDVAYASGTWEAIYNVIASTNVVIQAEVEGDVDRINHVKGEMYALRALAHFDLLKLYGQQNVNGSNLGIPYVDSYSSDISKLSPEDRYPERLTVDQVKERIYEDIETAISLMSVEYNNTTNKYITTYGAQALKSRIALYFGDWQDVVDAAEVVIASENYVVVPEEDYAKSWVEEGGANTIFELAFTGTDNNGIDGLFEMYHGNVYGDIVALDTIQRLFEPTDVRLSSTLLMKDANQQNVEVNFIGVGTNGGYLRNNGKYPTDDYSDNVDIIRYEEIVLNYAEALYELGINGLDGHSALDYLNLIPAERGATAYTVATKENILLERRKELCFEGFRFHDLARTGSDIPKFDPNQRHSGVTYGSYNFAFPIPEAELNANTNMVQNEGY